MNEYWTTLASLLGAYTFFRTLVQSILPPEIRSFFAKLFSRVCNWSSSYCHFDITDCDSVGPNELYNAVQLYLSNFPSITSATRVNITRHRNSSAFTFCLSSGESLFDSFSGASAVWEHVVNRLQSPSSRRFFGDEERCFTLKMRKKDNPLVLYSYLDHIMERASEIRRENQDRLLYTNSKCGSMQLWDPVPFKHPSNFKTLAMDPARKSEIIADLRSFADGRDFYQKTGRAWKRGYLLYGPPGTGKSSMIAAMANELKYDIYDLELTEVLTNSELRKLLMKTTSKSIIVIEDIDCSINLTNRSRPKKRAAHSPEAAEGRVGEGDDGRETITLSGLLNFTDGLWSCCGSERIFVFTTNHIEKLDPALLRCGRMDMHIHMSFCTFPALKILVRNYLDVEVDTELGDGVVKELEEVVDLAAMTPADISEVLIKNRLDTKKAISELLNVLRDKVERQARKGVEAGGKNLGEEEEHEKRALESPKEGIGLREEKDECEKVGGGGEEMKED